MTPSPPRSTPITPPFYFQSVPPIPIVFKSIAPSTSCIQDLDLVMSYQIVQHPWEQSPLQSLPSMDNPMDVEQLDVMVQMASYMPFDMIGNQSQLAHDVNTLSFTKAHIAHHVLEALRGEMGLMQMQFREVTSKHNALCEILVACQTKCLGLKQDATTTQ